MDHLSSRNVPLPPGAWAFPVLAQKGPARAGKRLRTEPSAEDQGRDVKQAMGTFGRSLGRVGITIPLLDHPSWSDCQQQNQHSRPSYF